jgi:hypothetical protein
MKQHRTDLLALLFGLAFATAGVAVIGAQSSAAISPRWATAAGLIVLGVVALGVTVARSIGSPHHDGFPHFRPASDQLGSDQPVPGAPISDAPPAGVSLEDPAG